MIPIFEQGAGTGIGYGKLTFIDRFDKICSEHTNAGRAKAFAFIFYDFQDHSLREILRSQGGFATLDRLAGADISIFYLHSGNRQAIREFNCFFMQTLNIHEEVILPCVVFFRKQDNQIVGMQVAQLYSQNLIHGLTELYVAIGNYKSALTMESDSNFLRWANNGGQFIGIEVFRAGLRRALEHLF
jgi:hypothetical protein